MFNWKQKYQTTDKTFFTNYAKSTYATRVQDKHEVCMKKYSKNGNKSEKKEYFVLKLLFEKKNTNIVDILDVLEDELCYYIVMEKYSNNLQQLINNNENGFTAKQILYLLRQILKGYYHLIELGIFHRNLEPKNIYYVEDNNNIIYKIGGFEYSKTLEDKDDIVDDCTKQFNRGYYQAPEQTDTNYCHKTDIYSLGLILLQMATKQQLKNPSGDLKTNKLENLCNMDKIDNELKALLCEMIVFDPNKRPTWSLLIKRMFYKIIQKNPYNEKALSLENQKNCFIKRIQKAKIDYKWILKDKDKSEMEINRFLKGIEHNNIIKVYEVLHEPECSEIYIIMEDCEGSLKDLLIKRELKVQEILDLVSQINDGYEFLEEQKIIHRDIKPENILYQIDNDKIKYKITDFGISRLADEGYTKCGTNLYSAPEVKGNSNYSNKCDIYSLGILIYYVGNKQQYPYEFKQEKIDEFFKKLKEQQSIEHCYPNNNVLGKEIKQLINEMIVFEANKRVAWGKDLKKLIQLIQDQLLIKKIQDSQSHKQYHPPNSNQPLIFKPIQNINQFSNQKQISPPLNNNNNNYYYFCNNNQKVQIQQKSDRNPEFPKSFSIDDRINKNQITPKSGSDNNQFTNINGQRSFIFQNQIKQGNQQKIQHNFNTMPSQDRHQLNWALQNNQQIQKNMTMQSFQPSKIPTINQIKKKENPF